MLNLVLERHFTAVMAELYAPPPTATQYRDHRDRRDAEQLSQMLGNSTTLYVGNLSFWTTEEQIYEIFSKCGEIKRIIMGLDRVKKTPCGFCFVEYYTRSDTEDCLKYVNGTKVDERVIRVDIDPGFTESRQFGRGKSGGQVRDEHRTDYDPGRGGYGKGAAAPSSGGDGPRGAKRQREREAEPEDTGEKKAPAASNNPRFRESKGDDEEGGN